MFEYANFLLLALFAAAAVDLALALAAKRTPQAAFGWLWGTEHFLFGNGGAAWRARCGAVLFTVGLASYEVSVAFCNSMARQTWPWVQGILAPVLDWLAFLCFAGKILLGTRYTWRSLGVAGSLYFVARWVYFNSQNIWWIGIVVAVLAAKDVALHRPLRAYLASGTAAVAAVAALHFAGIVAPELTSERNGLLRGTYGYGHPNTFGGLVMGLVLAYAMLRAPKLRWGDALVPLAAGVFLLLGPASRTAGLCCLALALLLALCRWRKDRPQGRKTPLLAAALVPLVGAVSYLLPLRLVKNGPWNSDFGPAWLSKIDHLLTNRLSLSWTAYRVYDVKIAGQVLADWPPMDNSFVFALYQFGPVVAALLAVLFAVALYGLTKTGRRAEVCCLGVMLLYSFMECQSFHLTTNPTALLLCGALYALPAGRWGKVHLPPQ